MLFFRLNDEGVVVEVLTSFLGEDRTKIVSRRDMKEFGDAERIAEQATKLTGTRYIAIDNGGGMWPRFDVIEAPVVGASVSYCFNGDYYPDGEIVHVTKGTLRQIRTSTGNVYYRRGNSGRWVMKGGTWSLVNGHRDERNPHI